MGRKNANYIYIYIYIYLSIYLSIYIYLYIYISSGVGDLELAFVPPGAADAWLKYPCSRVNIDKSLHDFAQHTDLV